MARGDNRREEGATGASLITDQVLVRIPSTSDITEVRSNPNDHLSPGLPTEYSHDEYDSKFHFVPEEHARQVHEYITRGMAVATTCEEEYTPITPYVILDDDHDSDKENCDPNQEDYEDAEEVLRNRQDAQRMCHDPSHGGFYMAEGAFYIRIGLPPRVVSGDCLVLSRCVLIDCHLHCRRTYPMSRDWGCISMSYQLSHVLPFVYAALGAIL